MERRYGMKKKIDWDVVLYASLMIIIALAIIVCVVLKIWVICEYGDMPITEVPSWAIPWLTNGR